MTFSANNALKNQAIRQYYLIFVLFIYEKILFQNCMHFKKCIFCFRTSNKIADNPYGYQDFLCSYGLKMPF